MTRTVFLADNDTSLGPPLTVDNDINGAAGGAIKLDDRAGSVLQDLFHGDFGSAQLGCDFEWNVAKHTD